MEHQKRIDKIILTGKLTLLSPCMIGSGDTDNSDMDILRDSQGRPYIPATSLVGVLRHFMEEHIPDLPREFFGFVENKEAHQSALSCKNLTITSCSDYEVTIRDGIKIDNKRGVVEEQKKYDYEVLYPVTKKDKTTTSFHFEMQINCPIDMPGKKESNEKEEPDESKGKEIAGKYAQLAKTIQHILEEGLIRVGAKTNNGMGKIKLQDSKLVYFDFSKKEDVLLWLQRGNNKYSEANKLDVERESFKNKRFVIHADFRLPQSVIIRSYSKDPDVPDATHLKVNNKYVLTGSSLKGAIRARAERIVNTLGKQSEIITTLFGNVDDKNPDAPAICGKVRVEETVLQDVEPELQTRIKIDRFTGGTIETALFETEPLFPKNNKYVQRISISVKNCEEHEAGLLLLVLKDLFTQDLAVGGEKNVGRGILQGGKAQIKWKENRREISVDDKNKPVVSDEDKEVLESWVQKLVAS